MRLTNSLKLKFNVGDHAVQHTPILEDDFEDCFESLAKLSALLTKYATKDHADLAYLLLNKAAKKGDTGMDRLLQSIRATTFFDGEMIETAFVKGLIDTHDEKEVFSTILFFTLESRFPSQKSVMLGSTLLTGLELLKAVIEGFTTAQLEL